MKKIILRIFFFLCSLAVMSVIFVLSAQNGEVSGNLSEGFSAVLQRFLEKILPQSATDFLLSYVRKGAHVFLYACLGVFVSGFLFTFSLGHGWVYFAVPWLFCLAYACLDEMHQYFVPGRACAIGDVCIDGIGFTFTILLSNIIYAFTHKKPTL